MMSSQSQQPTDQPTVDPQTVTMTKKPKRPLSGYNLFYRYKRNKVLEATAELSRASANDNGPIDKVKEQNVIRAVITSIPGLEGIPTDHPIYQQLNIQALHELRATNIRTSMDGKLFPNENARNRLHRKVHGMGFVEMGTLMRDMWSKVDDYTKSVFSELADIGRARYRQQMEEYKLNPFVEEEGEGDAAKKSAKKKKAPAKKKAKKTTTSGTKRPRSQDEGGLDLSAAIETVKAATAGIETPTEAAALKKTGSVHKIEATPKSSPKVSLRDLNNLMVNTSTSWEPLSLRQERRVSYTDMAINAITPCASSHVMRGAPSSAPTGGGSMMHDLHRLQAALPPPPLFNPNHVMGMASAMNPQVQGNQVHGNGFPLPGGGISGIQGVINRFRPQLSKGSSVGSGHSLCSVPTAVSGGTRSSSFTSALGIVPSSSSTSLTKSCSNSSESSSDFPREDSEDLNVKMLEEEEEATASAQDFIELIGKLADVEGTEDLDKIHLDEHEDEFDPIVDVLTAKGGGGNNKSDMMTIFGKPLHDVVHGGNVRPLSLEGLEIKNARARMA